MVPFQKKTLPGTTLDIAPTRLCPPPLQHKMNQFHYSTIIITEYSLFGCVIYSSAAPHYTNTTGQLKNK